MLNHVVQKEKKQMCFGSRLNLLVFVGLVSLRDVVLGVAIAMRVIGIFSLLTAIICRKAMGVLI